jgi:hypothetical protein
MDRPGEGQCEKNHISESIFYVFALEVTVPRRRRQIRADTVMKTRFWSTATQVNLALALGLVLVAAATGFALAELATPEQRKACTPDVYRLCAGEIPNVRAITNCLRRQKSNLSDACRAVFEQ